MKLYDLPRCNSIGQSLEEGERNIELQDINKQFASFFFAMRGDVIAKASFLSCVQLLQNVTNICIVQTLDTIFVQKIQYLIDLEIR